MSGDTLYYNAHYRGEPGGVLGLSAALSESGAAPEVKPKPEWEGSLAVFADRCDIFLSLRSHSDHKSAERERTGREVGL